MFNRGKRTGCRGAKLFTLENSLPRSRICFTFPRGFGTAVQRNHAKRLGREAYRNLKPRVKGGYDLILLVYPNTMTAFTEYKNQLRYLLAKAGVLR